MDALTAYDSYYTVLQEKYDRAYSKRTLETSPRATQNAFMDIGRLTAHEGWDPGHFITATMSLLSINHNHIVPGSLLNDVVVAAYRRLIFKGATVYTPESDWCYYATQLIRELDPAAGVTEYALLWSPMSCYPNWFRVLYPEHINAELFRMYGAAAHNELRNSLQLRSFIRKKSPIALAEMEELVGKYGDSIEEIPT